MLADDAIQLLTGFVDGELSSRQHKAALRLLHDSSEARELLLQLQENAHKIKQLPRRQLDARFASEVLLLIAERDVKPEQPFRAAAIRMRWLPYVAVGMAAAVLFVVSLSGALYLAFYADGLPLGPGGDFVKGDAPPLPRINPGNGKPGPIEPEPPPRKAPNPLIARVTEGVHREYAAVIPPERAPSINFTDLKDEGQAARQLAAELKKTDDLQLDVTVRNNPQAMERLKSVLSAYGVKLVVDPASDAVMKKSPGKAELLIYAENLSRDELSKIFKELAAGEKKTASPFTKVSVASLSKHEHQVVASLLGTDPVNRNPPDQKIIGKQPKPLPNTKVERVVVVLPQAPETKASEQVRLFLLQAARPQPGSVRVLVRIRQE